MKHCGKCPYSTICLPIGYDALCDYLDAVSKTFPEYQEAWYRIPEGCMHYQYERVKQRHTTTLRQMGWR